MSGGLNMKLNKILPELAVIFTVPFVILFGIANPDFYASANEKEGASYLDAMANQNIKEVEKNIENGVKPTKSEPVTTGSTDSTTTVTETKEPTTNGELGDVSCYMPYAYDASLADASSLSVQNGETSLKDLFADALFVGDSIMTGFDDYKIVNEGNVIAHVGAILESHLPENLDTIINYNPKILVLHYGLNEIEMSQYFLDDFIATYTANIKKIQAALPDTKIILVGLMPVLDTAIAREERFSRVKAYNERIRAMCVELGVAFENDLSIFQSHEDMYSKDGIHFAKGLYLLWMNDFVREMGIY